MKIIQNKQNRTSCNKLKMKYQPIRIRDTQMPHTYIRLLNFSSSTGWFIGLVLRKLSPSLSLHLSVSRAPSSGFFVPFLCCRFVSLFICMFVFVVCFFRGQDIYHYLLCWHKHHSLHSMLHFTNHQRRESYAYCRLLAMAKTCKLKRESNICKSEKKYSKIHS